MKMKKIVSLALCLMMILSFSVIASATEGASTYLRTFSDNFNDEVLTTVPSDYEVISGADYIGIKASSTEGNNILDFSKQAKGDTSQDVYQQVVASLYNKAAKSEGTAIKLSATMQNRVSGEAQYAELMFNISDDLKNYYSLRLYGNKSVVLNKCVDGDLTQLGTTLTVSSNKISPVITCYNGLITVDCGTAGKIIADDASPLNGGYFGMGVRGSGYFDDISFECPTEDAAYSNTFDDANSIANWYLSDTTNNVVDSGQLKFKNTKSIYAMYNGQSWNGGNFVADFTLSTSSNRMRYFFNYSENEGVSSGYMLQIMKSDNSVSLLKFTNGTSSTLTANNATSSVISTLATVTGRSDLISANVKVVYKNGNIKVYIGGGKVFDYTDTTPLNSGKMGFSASSGTGYADNLRVIPDKNIVDGINLAGTKDEVSIASGTFDMSYWISNAAGRTAYVNESGTMQFGSTSNDSCTMTYLGHKTEGSYIADFTMRQLGSSTGNSAYIRFNATDNKNHYKIKLEGGNSTKNPKMILQKSVNGTNTDLSSVAHVSIEKTQTIRIEYENGGNISVYSVDADGCATPIMQDIKDTTFTGGYIGVGAVNASLTVSEIKITEKEMMIFAPKVYVDDSLVAELPEEEGKDFTLKFKPSFEIADADTNILVAGYSGDTLADVKMISQATQSQFIDENSQIVVTFEVAEGEKIDKVAVYCWKMSTLVPLLDAIRVK